jgi:hypothetical protein
MYGAYQTMSVLESVRFLDSEHHFNECAVDAILRAGVQHTEPIMRKSWYDEIRACRRRQKIPGLAKGAGDPREKGASSFVSNLPQGALHIAAIFRAEDEFERLALRCTRTKIASELSVRGLHAVDAFRVFNPSRTGLVNCSELWGGLEWLGLPDLTPDQIHGLMRLLDHDNDGLLALHEFKQAFTDARFSHSESLAARPCLDLSRIDIKRKAITELAMAGVHTRQRTRVSIGKAMLARIKIKACLQTQFDLIWNSSGLGAHTECGVWAPNVNLGVHKANRHRLCVGHYAQRGLAGPARTSTRQERLTLEVTDLNVLRVKTSGSMASVIAELFPPPTRWRQVWSTVGKRIEGHLYAWAAVPPSPDFVALGMVCTISDEPPVATKFHCVPRKWCRPISSQVRLIWDDSGTGGRSGAFWQVGSYGLLHVTRGHLPPAKEGIYELASSRFMLGHGDSSGETSQSCDGPSHPE